MKNSIKPAVNTAEDLDIQADWDFHDNHDINNVTLRQFLRPSLIVLAIGGCYTYDPSVIKTGSETSEGRPYRTAGLIYRIFYLLACLAWCAKCFVSFFTLPSNFILFNVVVAVWCVQVLLTFLVYLKSHYVKYGGQRKAFNLWDSEIRPLIDDLGLEFPADKIKKRFFIYLMIACTWCVSNITGMALLAADVFAGGFGVYYSAPFAISVPTTVISLSLTIPLVLAWVMLNYYVVCLCTLLISVFETFNDFVANVISQKSPNLSCQFYKIRLLQLNLSKMVSELDRDFGYHFATSFVLNIGISSYMIYQILKTSMEIMNIIIFLIWIVGCLFSVGATSVFAAFVNEAVCEPYLFSLNKFQFSSKSKSK